MSIPPPNMNTTLPPVKRFTPSRMFQNMSMSVGKGIWTTSDQFIKFPLKPLLPAILATGMIIYQRGDETKKGHNPNPKTIQILTDLGIASFLINSTAGFYSVLAFLKTLFDMGLQNDAMDKYKSVIQNAGVFTSAFIGIRAGKIWAEGKTQVEDGSLRKSLNSIPVQRWIQQNHGTGGIHDQVAQRLYQLTSEMHHLNSLKDNMPAFKKFRNETVLPHIGMTLESMKAPEVRQSMGSHKAFKELFATMEHNQDMYVRIARMINPPVAGLLITTFIGVPIIREMSRWLEKNHPELRGKHVEYFRFPELANTKGNYHGPGNAHSVDAGHGGNSHGGGESDGHSFGNIPGLSGLLGGGGGGGGGHFK